MSARTKILTLPEQHGFTYLWALFAVMLLGLGAGKSLEIYHQQTQREKEAELLYVGEQYQKAIRSYYYSSPGMLKQYPTSLDDLLLDRRLLTLRRHIRQRYSDPITGSTGWGLVRTQEGGIIGVYSLSEQASLKQAGFPDELADFAGTTRYSQWKFVFLPKRE